MRHKLIAAFAVLLPVSFLDAAPVDIIATPQDLSGTLGHNFFHDAHTTTGGAILGYVDLDPTGTNWYDPVAGTLAIDLNIYSDSSLTTLIGTASGTGANLHHAAFDDGPGDLVGTITFEFGTLDWDDTTLYFTDKHYAASGAGHVANSWENGFLTLWGADGWDDQQGDYCDPVLGLDIVIQTTMPEPASLCLMACGLAGAAVARRRRRRSPAAS